MQYGLEIIFNILSDIQYRLLKNICVDHFFLLRTFPVAIMVPLLFHYDEVHIPDDCTR